MHNSSSNVIVLSFLFPSRLRNHQENAQNVSSKIKDIFTGDDNALRNEIESFKVQYVQKRIEMSKKEIALRSVESDLSRISTQIKENDQNYHLLLKDHTRELKLHAEKIDYIQKICEKLDINADFDIKCGNDRAADLIVHIQNALVKVDDKIQKIIAATNEIDAKQEKDIQAHRSDEIRINSEIDSIVEQLNELERELNENKVEFTVVEQTDDNLNEIRMEIAKNKSVLEQLMATNNTESFRNEIAMHCDEEQKLSDKLNEIDVQITSITKLATLLADIRTKENYINKRQDEIRDIKEKHCTSFHILFPNENIENSFKQRIDALGKELRTQTKLLEKKIQSIDNEIQRTKNKLQNKKQESDNFEEELKKLEAEINKECNQKPFAEVLTSTKENVEKYQMEYSALQSSGVFYEK